MGIEDIPGSDSAGQEVRIQSRAYVLNGSEEQTHLILVLEQPNFARPLTRQEF